MPRDPDDTKQQIIDALKGTDDRDPGTGPPPKSAPTHDLVRGLDEQMAERPLPQVRPRRRDNPTFMLWAGILVLAFNIVNMIVHLTTAFDNVRIWEGSTIPSDLTSAEILAETTYQTWTATSCIVGVLVAIALITAGFIRKGRQT